MKPQAHSGQSSPALDDLPVTDYFAALGFPRRPWLEPDEVQERFVSLSASYHPDRTHNAPATEQASASNRFADLNAARQCLRDSAHRIRHLLELERGVPIAQLEWLPPDAADEFFKWGQACKEVDRFLDQRPDPASPLLELQHFKRTMEWKESLEQMLAEISRRQSGVEEQIRQLNQAWENAPKAAEERMRTLPLAQLERLFRSLNYLLRWQERVRGRLTRLSI